MAPSIESVAKRGLSVADRLKAVDSRLALHVLLAELSAQMAAGKLRWTRTQVLFFLPNRWHGAAGDYFLGERFRDPHDLPPEPTEVVAESLEKSLERARSLTDEVFDDDDRADDVSPLAGIPGLPELLAEAEPEGTDPIPQMLRALREEMRAVSRQQPKRFRLKGGRCVRGDGGQFVYQFTWSSEPDPFTPGELRVDKRRVAARVGDAVPAEAIRHELVVEEWLGPTVDRAVFLVDPTFLLRVVYVALKRADDTSPDASQWAAKLAFPPMRNVALDAVHQAIDGSLNEQQQKAATIAASVDRAYVWGPPGTGKTTTIGALVRRQARGNRRVLILSPYNVAVDEAIQSVAARDSDNLRVVRFGRAGEKVRELGLDMESQLEKHATRSGLLFAARQLLASLSKEPGERFSPPATMRECLDELGAMVIRRGGARDDPQTERLTKTIHKLRKEFRAPENDILSGADVVGCTMALAFLKKDILARPFHQLVIDEASVVRTPEATVAATSAAAPIAFFGDPKQLPAIVVSPGPMTKKWIGRSPFSLAGIERPSDAGGACIMLEEQHRMSPPVRALVSTMFYEGTLRDGARAPARGRVIVLDTSQSGARATPKFTKLSHSKENFIHRAIVAETLRALGRCDPDTSALVLSPFVAQKRGYRREATTTRALRRAVRFETIHTSQGTEQDVVILDLVLAGEGIGTKSRMLDEHRNPHLANLLNVAVSRARQTLIVVGDIALVEREYGGELLDRFVKCACNIGSRVQVPRGLTGLGEALDQALGR